MIIPAKKFSEINFAHKQPLKILQFRADKHNWEEGWETPYISKLIDTLTAGMVVFDIGSENGEFGALAAKIVGGVNVHLFEPSPDYWPNVKAIWDENILQTPTGCFDGYVGSNTDFSINEHNFGWPDSISGDLFEGTHQCIPNADTNKTITIDSYCNILNVFPDVIMMDIEGAELDAILGAEETVINHSPIFFISIHSNELIKQRSGGSKDDVFSFFNKHGYTAHHINTDHEEHWKFYKQ